MYNWLFDKSGIARLLLYDDRFISKDGRNIGWLVGNNVYSLNGMHLGWYEKGVLYDNHNRCIAFTQNATGNIPFMPGVGGVPGMPGIPGRLAMPGLSGVPGRPGYGGWSDRDVEEFFLNN